jgi:RHS repeat-associated protein
MQAPWRHCWLYRFAILTALFLSLTYHSPGQTIEAVLRALNLRVAYSGGTPLQWSDNVPAFPADGTITSLSDAIDALNMASQTYEQVQWSFYACDPNTLHLVNFGFGGGYYSYYSGTPAPLLLPEVGIFTVNNWRTKLRLLASGIDQLIAVVNPGNVTGSSVTYTDQEGSGDQAVGFSLNFPYLSAAGGDASSSTSGPTASDSPLGGELFGWQGYALTTTTQSISGPTLYSSSSSDQVSATTSINVDITNFNASIAAPGVSLPTDGTMVMYTMLGNYIGDPFSGFVQDVANNSQGTLLLNTWEPIAMQDGGGGSFSIGTPGATDLLNPFSWSGLSVPTIIGEGMGPPISGLTGDTSSYLQISAGTQSYNGAYLGIGYNLVFLPNFALLVPASGKQQGVAPYGFGTVETTVKNGELVRIQLGRGKTDPNQVAWLGSRPDGFASLIFRGSPAQFEVLYEEDPQKYTDNPIGGGSYVEPQAVDNQQFVDAGFPYGWNQYISIWSNPHLRQVLGGDVLVDVHYDNTYQRTLKFYWASQAGSKAGHFYSPSGNPFKTVILSNPSVDSSGLAQDTAHLRVDDNDQVYHEILHVTNQDTFGSATWTDQYTFSAGPNANDTTYQDVIQVGNLSTDPTTNLTTTPWTVTQSWQGGVVSTQQISWLGDPVNSGDWAEMASLQDTRNGVTRKTTFNWQPANNWNGNILAGVQYGTSDVNWQQNGRATNFDNYGNITWDSRQIAGQYYTATGGFSGNVYSFTENLNETPFRSTKAAYNSGLSSVTLSVNNTQQATYNYHAPSGYDGSPPWTLSEVDYPSGYEEKYTSIASGDTTTTTASSGWGSSLSNGTVTTLVTNSYGGLISRSVTSGGVTLDYASGDSFTPWGAPQSVLNILGEETQITYAGSGVYWADATNITDPSGRNSKVQNPDWLDRPGSITQGAETFTFNFSNPLSPSYSSSANYTASQTFSPFGDLTAGNSGFGGGSSYTINPSGQSSSTVDGRTVSLAVDSSGFLSSVGNGQGSRGGSTVLGADGSGLYTQVTESTKTGGSSGNIVTTHYDGLGRVVSIKHPDANGNSITDQWAYDDTSRTVTFTPGAGPTEQTTVSTLSSDGGTLTITKGGNNYLQQVRSVQNGSVIMTSNLFDDSDGSGGSWKPISSQAVNPGQGSTTFTPWGLSADALTVSENASQRQITGGLEGNSLTIAKAQGVPSTISGTFSGVSVNLNASSSSNLLTGATGTVGGMNSGFGLDVNGRVTSLTGPGTNQTFTYGNGGGGFTFSVSDSTQGTTGSYAADSVGDTTAITPADSLTLTMSTSDTASGHQTTVNSLLSIDSNFGGDTLSKNYPGILDTYTRNSDGTVSVASESGSGGSANVTVNEAPTSRTTSYDGGAIVENFYNSGPRKNVSGPNDARTSTWLHGQLNTEVFTAGPWSGWEIDRGQDSNGRLNSITVKQSGSTVKTFSFDYDQYSRLSGSHGLVDAVYATRDTAGRFQSLTRGSSATQNTLTSTWGYNSSNALILSLAHTGVAGTFSFDFSYDSRLRITSRTATTGVNWNSMGYTSISQLSQALPVPARASTVTYGYDSRGNRNSGTGYSQGTNTLDQTGSRTLTSRGFGISGSVAPLAQVSVQTSLSSSWQNLSVNPTTGAFSNTWSVGLDYNGGNTSLIGITVLGSYPGVGYNGATAISEADLTVVVPPTNETLSYDGPGRLAADAYWTYQWDSLGRLTGMTRKAGTSTVVGAASESLSFTYDSDGRRTGKTHNITYTNKTTRIETSQVLWSGWLPIYEQRTVTGTSLTTAVTLPARWFQWGVDRSDTLDGAGGIGGLMAIYEEGGRTLLPIDDGLGNIIAVVDASTGQAVAYYNYGPFGEPYGDSGDTTACPFRFQTKWYDQECQHYYFGYRHYDPSQGRWLSRDPLGETGGFNLYAYCGNDPVNRCDPLGLDVWEGETILDLTRFYNTIRKSNGLIASKKAEIARLELLEQQYLKNFNYDNLIARNRAGNEVFRLGDEVKDLEDTVSWAQNQIRDFDRWDVGRNGIIDPGEAEAAENTKNQGSDFELFVNILTIGEGTAMRAGAKLAIEDVAEGVAGRVLRKSAATTVLNSGGDVMLDALGPARLSNPAEFELTLNRIAAAGHEVRVSSRIDNFFSPGLRPGQAGQLTINEDISISGLRHEARHVWDYDALGRPGFRMTPEQYWQSEFDAYMIEINMARRMQRFDLGRELLDMARQRKLDLLGP